MTLEDLDKKYKELFPGIVKKPVVAETPATTDLDSEYNRLFGKTTLDKGISVSLTSDLKGLKIEDTGEIISREKFTPEMLTIHKDLLGQTLKAQQEEAAKIPTTTWGVAKEMGKGILGGVKKELFGDKTTIGLLSKETLDYLPEVMIENIKKIPAKVEMAVSLHIPGVRDEYIKKNPQAVIDFADDYEKIVGPFVRRMYPTKIPLAIAEKVVGKKLASTYEELSQKHPFTTAVSGLMGDIYNLVAISRLTGGIGSVIQVPGYVKVLLPTLSRYIPAAISSGSTFGLKGVLDESISQFEKGEFSPTKIAMEGGKNFLFGTLLAGPMVSKSISNQILGSGLVMGGFTALEGYLKDGTLDQNDMLNIGSNTILGMVFASLGVKSRVSKIQQQEFYNFSHQQLVTKVGETNALLIEQAELATLLSKAYPEKSFVEIMKMVRLFPKDFPTISIKLPPAIYQQIETQIPANLKGIRFLPETQQIVLTDTVVKTAKELVNKGVPAWQALFKGLEGIGFPRIEIPQTPPTIPIPPTIITPPPAKPVKPSDLIIAKQTPEMVKPMVKPEIAPTEGVEEVKVIARKEPSAIKGAGTKQYTVKDHPEVYTDSYLLLEDRKPEEVKKWQERQQEEYKPAPIDYSSIKAIYPKEKTEPVKFIKFEKSEPVNIAHLDVGKETSIAVNAEYYQWLKKEGYTIKSTGDEMKPLVLERNGKEVGLLMAIKEAGKSVKDFVITPLETKKLEEQVDEIVDIVLGRKPAVEKVAEIEKVVKPTEEVKIAPERPEAIKEAIPAEKGIIPKELEPLAQEARKYKSAEEFVKKTPNVFTRVGVETTPERGGTFYSKYAQPGVEGKVGLFELPINYKVKTITQAERTGEMLKVVSKDISSQIVKEGGDWQTYLIKLVKRSGFTEQELYTKAEKALAKKYSNFDAVKIDGELFVLGDKPLPKIADQFIDFYTQATKGIKEVEPEEIDKGEELEKIYQENKAKEEVKRQPPIGATIKITSEGSLKKPITPNMVSQLRTHFENFKKRINELISPLYFHKNAPPELRNAIRTDVIGGLNKVYESRNKNQITLWGGMEEKDIASSIEIIRLRDQVARIKADKGNPEITLKEAEESLAKAEKEASPEALKSAETYRLLAKKYTQDLVDRGKLDSDELMEDYMRHYVVDYTPDWVFNKGIPARLRQPFRGYLKKAGKTTKEYRVDEDTILGQFLEVEHDNMIEDFIVSQSEKYDIKPKLDKEKLAEVLGVNKETGRTKPIKPGRIYIIDEKRYRGFNPAAPFGRVIFPTEEGLMALGRYRKTYLIPEGIYNTFRDFSERGSTIVFYTNRIVSYWKTMAILSHFSSFNINNMVGDTWMALLQSPAPQRVLAEIPTTINYLVNKNPSSYLKELDKFIKDNDIVAATYIQGELPKIRQSRNPILYILQKSQNFSQFRESIMRIANASYLLKESKKGNADKLIDYFSYMGLEGLSEEKALGKVARDILVDYGWTSKTFNRYVRGFAFPFGTWYFKGSRLIWKFIGRHWGKALLWLLGIPALASLWNDRNKKTRELEGELPDYVQNRVHFILGENPDGTVRVWGLQLPQDALIGTKIFSIAVNQANLVAIGKKTPKEAAIYTIKTWGIQEAKGIVYLTNFFVRFIQGLVQRKDPYDKAPIYSMDPDKMGGAKKLKEQGLFFLKTMFPVISVYIKDYTQGKPIDVTTKNYMDKLVGLGALGINDIGKRDKVYFEGKEVEWEDVDKLKEIYGNELSILDKMEDRWIASDLYPEEFIKIEEYKKILEEMRNMYAKYVPEAKDIPIEDIASGLGERLTNRLGNSTDSAKKWYQIKLERAKTDEEKKKLGEKYKEIRQQNLIDAINSSSKTAKEIFELYLKEK